MNDDAITRIANLPGHMLQSRLLRRVHPERRALMLEIAVGLLFGAPADIPFARRFFAALTDRIEHARNTQEVEMLQGVLHAAAGTSGPVVLDRVHEEELNELAHWLEGLRRLAQVYRDILALLRAEEAPPSARDERRWGRS